MAAPSRRPTLAVVVLGAFLCSLAAALSSAEAKVHHHTWDIAYRRKSLDCFEKLAVTVNGEAPGPTIRATQGDTVAVTVRNMLETENTGIHWHGILQRGSPWADGTVGVTQCPILPGESFTYRFVVDRPGTYLYHEHYGMQRVAGLDGMLVVSESDGVVKPFTYDEEPPSSSWTVSADQRSRNVRLLSCCSRRRLQCLVRLAGAVHRRAGEDLPRPHSSLNFEIEGHSMTVVEADGHYVRPVVVDSLFVYSGETYSVLVKADQDPSRNYWAASHVVGRRRETPSALAVLSYAGNDPRSPPPAGPAWDDAAPRVAQSRSPAAAHPDHVLPAPPRPDRTLLLLNTQNRIDGHVRWAINGLSLRFPATPYLVSMKRGLRGAYDDQRPPADAYDNYRSFDIASPPAANGTVASAAYRLALGSVVDVVLQNTAALNGRSETHPWHLHGHDFWVLGYGEGKFEQHSLNILRSEESDPLQDQKSLILWQTTQVLWLA
ncbi:hypothetical protein SETIT_6G006300v2 [Setaria italica]|uniref:L-ascorbate oxidase n=1 Tax=Setaria italica TaxID=4555 RepID=A0A368RGU4_SETIT|nr:hypothetical protein SETIT_6G006300v2 [Setaria italica]